MIPRRALSTVVAVVLLAPSLLAGPGWAVPETEPNDTSTEATEILADTASYTGTLTPATDTADIYKVLLNRSAGSVEEAKVELDKTTDLGQVRLYIYDGLGYLIAWNATLGTGVMTADVTAPSTGPVFIHVLLWPQSPKTDYILNVTKSVLSASPPAVDDNNSPSGAQAAGDGDELVAPVSSLLDAQDFFFLDLATPAGSRDVLTAFLEVPPGCDAALELYRGSDTSYIAQAETGNIHQPDFGSNETLYFVAQQAGRHYLRLWAEHGAGDCRLSIRVFRGFADADNDLDNATEVSTDGTLAGNVSVGYDDQDYYKVLLRLETSMDLTLDIPDHSGWSGLPRLNLYLFEPGRTVVNSSTGSGAVERVGYTAAVTGWHLIKVGAALNSAGNYTLEVRTVQPPVVLQEEVKLALDEDTSGTVDLDEVFEDQSARPLAFNFTPAENVELSLIGPVLSLRPRANWNGRLFSTLSALNEEGKRAYAELNLTVRPVNDPPTAQLAEFNDSAVEDEPYMLPVTVFSLFNDVDGDHLNYSCEAASHVLTTITTDGTLTAVPLKDWHGTESFNLTATDPSGASASMLVRLRFSAVNDPPEVAWTPGNLTFDEDLYTTVDLLRAFRDPDGEAMTFSASGGLALLVLIQNGTAFVRAVYPDWHDAEMLTFIARDGRNATASFTVNFTVRPVNDPPQVWRSLPNQTVREDQPSAPLNLYNYFRDPDGENLTFNQSTFIFLTVNITPDGWVTFTPVPNWSGRESGTILALDASGAQAVLSVNLTVEAVDDPPVFAKTTVGPSGGSTETDFTFTAVVSDPDSDDVTVKLVVGRRTLTMKAVSGNLRTGATFQVKTRLPEGPNTYYFTAESDRSNTATSSQELKVEAKNPDNTLLYIALALITIVVIALALAFSPSRGRDEDQEEE